MRAEGVFMFKLFEKWSLVLLVKLMSLGKRPGDGTFGPGYHDLKN